MNAPPSRRPETIALAVISADGRLTRHDAPGTAFASPADQVAFQRDLGTCDCSACGSATYVQARAMILARLSPTRRRLVLTRDPARFAADAVPGQLEFTAESPRTLLARLGAEGHRRCAVLGGAQVYAAFADADLVDEWRLTIEPRIFGEGLPLCPGARDPRLALAGIEHLGGGTVALRYRAVR